MSNLITLGGQAVDAELNERVSTQRQLESPPREFSVLPFWFWNDDLDKDEIRGQIADFDAHGVYGFVIHPRVGLPRSIGWMTDAMLGFMRVAIDEAAARQMKVILYDEGMYPSGSSAGQVVAHNAKLACRGLTMRPLGMNSDIHLPEGHNLVARVATARGEEIAVVDRPVKSVVRGLHYIEDGPAEDEPPMGDILNPETANAVLSLVYDRLYEAFGSHFGKTIIGIFTDEPNPLGRCLEPSVWPGTAGIMTEINRILGYDFTPHLPSLWHDEPDADRYRRDYRRAICKRIEEAWYEPLSRWCASHGVALCGHPSAGDEIGALRHFHIPGQDLVWRCVEPGKASALEGPESTQAKCSSSAMIHGRRRRNSNEFCGAYGHETTFEEFQWLAWWCLVRGVNLLIPHAFYYSVRGHRRDERPPQVGLHSPWWGQFKGFADICRRLCWVNTDSYHVCDIAILTAADRCPWLAAKSCFEHQLDFNYLDMETLLTEAVIHRHEVGVAGMRYRSLIVEEMSLLTDAAKAKLQPMIDSGRVVPWSKDSILVLERLSVRDVRLSVPHPDLRYRHVCKQGVHFYIFFNEGSRKVDTSFTISEKGSRAWIDIKSGRPMMRSNPQRLVLSPQEIALHRVTP